MAEAKASIVVTGVGARTPIGAHAAQTAASVRAGLNRFTGWPHAGMTFGGEDETMAASFLTPDLGDDSWTEKVTALIEQPLAEAICDADLEGAGPPTRIATFLATPRVDVSRPDAIRLDDMCEDLRDDLPGPLRGCPLELVALGDCAGLAALARAGELLARNLADVCVVGGVDSLLESTRLEQLYSADRLKVPTTSSGLIPGEAAAFVVLERDVHARQRGAPVLARVAAVALERDEPWQSGAATTAAGIGRCLRVATGALQGAGAATAIINNLNGERWRFLEWSLAETRCLGGLPHGWRLWHPADCLGDVGAAFGPLATALAARAFARHYAGSGGIIIAAMSDSGERGALALSPPEGAN